jgi:hypothetical protein
VHDLRWVTVYTAQGRLAAEMIKALLESFNIPAILSQESVGATYGLTVGDLGEVEVRVITSHENEALDVLRAMDNGDLEFQDPDEPNKGVDSQSATKL